METELWPIFGGREAFEDAPADITERHMLAWQARKEAEYQQQKEEQRKIDKAQHKSH